MDKPVVADKKGLEGVGAVCAGDCMLHGCAFNDGAVDCDTCERGNIVPLPERDTGVEALVRERGAKYGHPKDNFETIAAMWTAWAKRRGILKEGERFDCEDVAWMNALQKAAREAFSHHEDNERDVVGYMKTLEMLREKCSRQS